MNKSYIKPISIFFITVIITYSLCFQINIHNNVFESGQVFSPDNKYNLYAISSYRWDDNKACYYFEIATNNNYNDLSLVYGAISGFLYVNDKMATQPVSFSKFSQLSLNTFVSENSDTITVSVYSQKNPSNFPIYITTADGATRAVTMYNLIFAFCLGITFLMSLYGLSLYINKKSEKYLAWFSVYTGALTLWSLSSVFLDLDYVFFQPFFSYAYGWCAFLDIVICFKMFDIKPPSPFNYVLEAKGVVLVLVIWAIIETICQPAFKDYYYIFFISIAVLIYSCSQNKKGALLLLIGHTISMGMRLTIAFSPLKMTSVSYILMAMRYSKLFNLPFAICCMFMINKLLSEKFTEAEVLTAKLENANKILETKVNERTQELRDQQMQKNIFMTNIFHDLRTPIFILEGCIKKIKHHPITAIQEIPIAEERLNFIRHLIDDLFLLAKFEDKKVILETEIVPLDTILNKILSACLLMSNKKNIALISNISCSCTTWGDEYRLEQAFQNIIVNAIYYTKPGGTINVDMIKINKNAFITIKDTGVGIPEEDLDKLFSRYYRISGKNKHESTGLGLSIAYEIINWHGGSINVKSIVGTGTEFTIQLPLITD